MSTTREYRSAWYVIGITLALTVLHPTQTAFAAPTDLDSSYAADGRYEYATETRRSEIRASVMQSDGATVHVGVCPAPSFSARPCILRLSADGVFDQGFGVGTAGQARTLTDITSAHAVAVDSLGRIIVVGECTDVNSSMFAMCAQRRLANGLLDPSFGGGTVTLLAAPRSVAKTVLIESDDRVVIAGQCDQDRWCIARLTTTGLLDSSFASGSGISRQTWPGPSSANTQITALLHAADGRYIAVGGCRDSQPGLRACIGGFDQSGSFFLPVAVGVFRMPRESSRVVAAGWQANGKLVVVANCADASVAELCLMRLTPGAGVDTTFGDAGFVQTLIDTSSFARAAVIQEDGRIAVVGTCSGRACAVRYEIDGSLDRSFGDNGAFQPTGNSPSTFVTTEFSALQIDASTRWVVAALCYSPLYTDVRLCVQRMKGGPTDYARCSLDIDGDGVIASEVDLALLLRSTMGFSENGITEGVSIASHASRRDAPAIRRFLITHCNLRLQ
jgi:uncharacterized delta-60 repeat protein